MGDCQSARKPVEAADPAPMGPSGMSNKVALGAGCYWGTEKFIKREFEKKFPGSIIMESTKVGFMSPYDEPKIKNPTYRQVCTGASGHVEVLNVEMTNDDPEKYFEELMRFFFSFHDPTTLNRQGNDTGFQYASYIFVGDDMQKEIAEKVKNELQEHLDNKKITRYSGKTVTTLISPIKEFTEATEDHQEYLAKNASGYCNHFLRFKEWPK